MKRERNALADVMALWAVAIGCVVALDVILYVDWLAAMGHLP